MTDLERDLYNALELLRGLVKENHGVPRYTVTPGAALNSIIEEVVDPVLSRALDTLVYDLTHRT